VRCSASLNPELKRAQADGQPWWHIPCLATASEGISLRGAGRPPRVVSGRRARVRADMQTALPVSHTTKSQEAGELGRRGGGPEREATCARCCPYNRGTRLTSRTGGARSPWPTTARSGPCARAWSAWRRARWRCESWGAPTADGRSSTCIRAKVSGTGAIWPGYRPGEPHHRPGDDEPRHYALDFTPRPPCLDLVMPVEVAPPGAVILETVQTSASDWRCWRPSTSSFEGGATMPCSDLFWMHFLDVFPKALGGALGILPAVLGFWGGLLTISRVLDARREAARAPQGTVRPRVAGVRAGAAGDQLRVPPPAWQWDGGVTHG
jgi:hypothetical protein